MDKTALYNKLLLYVNVLIFVTIMTIDALIKNMALNYYCLFVVVFPSVLTKNIY